MKTLSIYKRFPEAPEVIKKLIGVMNVKTIIVPVQAPGALSFECLEIEYDPKQIEEITILKTAGITVKNEHRVIKTWQQKRKEYVMQRALKRTLAR